MRREEKPTRCHCMLYCTCDTLNMFRSLLCPSSAAPDYMYASPPMVCSAWLLAVGGQVQGSRVCVQEEGCCTSFTVTSSWFFFSTHMQQCTDRQTDIKWEDMFKAVLCKPLSPRSHPNFFIALFNSVAKKLFLDGNNIVGTVASLPSLNLRL